MISLPSLTSSYFVISARNIPQRRAPKPFLTSQRAPHAVHSFAVGKAPAAGATVDAPPASLYDVLGLAPGATSQEIKAAYRRLARTCHPDVAAHATADEFMRVHAAYAVLSDPDKRADYDRELIAFSWRQRRSSWPRAASSTSSFSRRSWETDQCW